MKAFLISLLVIGALRAQSPAQVSAETSDRALGVIIRSMTGPARLDCAQAVIDQHNKAHPERRIARVDDIRLELYGKPTPQQQAAGKACAQRVLAEDGHKQALGTVVKNTTHKSVPNLTHLPKPHHINLTYVTRRYYKYFLYCNLVPRARDPQVVAASPLKSHC